MVLDGFKPDRYDITGALVFLIEDPEQPGRLPWLAVGRGASVPRPFMGWVGLAYRC